ncbi:quinol monooxygenase YgiN [Roseateles depolymerans]|uniref:Antibiotic biosynthesis monooxygenase n=1 Tax=Roseateles depolymerans TaxID=76731 RepID=A0A0U3MDN0_9BURK|nr:Antibiotic biosynthesis monooxygenase [Roseateles depolymerans]REG19381.1 quinol monooxygenase YgiN [Roseateles depolymerans]
MPDSTASSAASSHASASPSSTAAAPASPYLQVIAHYHAKPGLGDQVSELLGQLTEATRQEPANLSYEFFRSPQDPDRFVILEQYTDAAGLDAHRASEHFQRLGFGTIIPMLVSRTVTSAMVYAAEPGMPARAVSR